MPSRATRICSTTRRGPSLENRRVSPFTTQHGFRLHSFGLGIAGRNLDRFLAGPHLDTHQHLDQGAFTIFKRRDLAPKTGHYDSNIRGGHQLAWYVRTISSNGLLIGDPRESHRGFIGAMGCDPDGTGSKVRTPDGSGELCPPNDGGQRTMAPFSLAPPGPDSFTRIRRFSMSPVSSRSGGRRERQRGGRNHQRLQQPRYHTPATGEGRKSVSPLCTCGNRMCLCGGYGREHTAGVRETLAAAQLDQIRVEGKAKA